ncbi:MAG: glycosyltransferase family 61 protein [Acidisphaera sp.]|nr:glycosyltransferase family 61 protein [Acidisphaera sp.]
MINSEQVEEKVASWGFTPYSLEKLSFEEQIALFRRAEFVIAPHGAGLSNLVFCAGDAKVIEFMPDPETRPFFWRLSAKLGLTHAMLHCGRSTTRTKRTGSTVACTSISTVSTPSSG